MDCCSKYPTDYTRPCHHTIPQSIGSGISGCASTNLYGPRLVHPSTLRYPSSLNRNGFPPPIGYDGFGSPVPPPPPPQLPQSSQIQPIAGTLGNTLPPTHPYQNYDLRYDPSSRSYSNFVSSNSSTPLYPYNNSNGFSYGHLNSRYYNHHYHQQQQQQHHQQQQQQAQHYYDSYGRIIGANHPYSYHHHNYHTLRNSLNPSSSLNGSNSAAYHHHVYGHRHNTPYHSLRGLDYHIPPPAQYYPPHHHQNGNSSLQHFNSSSLYSSSHSLNMSSANHNDLIQQQNYSAQQQQDQSLHNNLTKDSIFHNPTINNTPSPIEHQNDTNRFSMNNGMSRQETLTDNDGVIEINCNNSDKEMNARCNSTQSIVNSPSDNCTTTINTNNNNDSTILNSELTVAASSPLTNGSADSGISGCGNIGTDGSYQNNKNNSKNENENYDNDNNNNNIGQLENDNENDVEENCENKQNIQHIISANDKELQDLQSSDVDSTELKDTKPELKNIKDSEKVINRISDSNKRKLDCSTPIINTSPSILERSATPFVHQQQYHSQQQQQYNNSNYQSRYYNSSPATLTPTGQNNNNYSPYYQNCYTPLSNRSNWSPYSSPHYNYSYNYSPTPTIIKSTPTIRKQRSFSPISNNRRRKPQQQRKKPISKTTSSLLQTTTTIIRNKNRVLECDFIPSKKSKRKNKSESDDSFEFREEIKDIKPLPGFQQAFGSTEIGRFSEIFFNTPSDDSPYYDNIPYGYESEADASMSPYPWETGDSLEGPHFNLHIGAASLKSCYTDHLNSIINDSPLLENNSNYFSGIRCNDY